MEEDLCSSFHLLLLPMIMFLGTEPLLCYIINFSVKFPSQFFPTALSSEAPWSLFSVIFFFTSWPISSAFHKFFCCIDTTSSCIISAFLASNKIFVQLMFCEVFLCICFFFFSLLAYYLTECRLFFKHAAFFAVNLLSGETFSSELFHLCNSSHAIKYFHKFQHFILYSLIIYY